MVGAEPDLFEEFGRAIRRNGRVLFEFRFAGFIDEQAPDSAQETIDAFDSFGAPGLGHFERAHEHFVQAKRVGADTRLQDVIGIDDVPA